MFAQIILSNRNILNLFLYMHHIEMQKAKQGIFENSSGFLYVAKLQTDSTEYWFSSLVRKTSIHSECMGKKNPQKDTKNNQSRNPATDPNLRMKFSIVIYLFLLSLLWICFPRPWSELLGIFPLPALSTFCLKQAS